MIQWHACAPSIFDAHYGETKVTHKSTAILSISMSISTADGLRNQNILEDEIHKAKDYLLSKIEKQKEVVTLILGGPTKYYNYDNESMIQIFSKINRQILEKNMQLIIIPSNRTPEKIIQFAKEYFNKNRLIVDSVDKQAYLSSLALAKYIIVTCDSSSMISEAALTGKPVYVAMIPAMRNDIRFQKFRNLLESMNIIRKLEDDLDTWSYEKLDETNRIAKKIKSKLF